MVNLIHICDHSCVEARFYVLGFTSTSWFCFDYNSIWILHFPFPSVSKHIIVSDSLCEFVDNSLCFQLL